MPSSATEKRRSPTRSSPVMASAWRSSVVRHSPVARSQILMVVSLDAVATLSTSHAAAFSGASQGQGATHHRPRPLQAPHCCDPLRVPLQHGESLPRVCIPHRRRAVLRAHREAEAVGVESRDGPRVAGTAPQGRHPPVGPRPYHHGPVLASHGEVMLRHLPPEAR